MISSFRGVVVSVGSNCCVVEVGGIGFSISVPTQVAASLKVGQNTTLVTMLIVREDSLTLYGFLHQDQRDVFEIMLGVSGIGPRIALAILSAYEPGIIRLGVSNGDDKMFSRVSGIGPKGARRIILELADKLPPLREVDSKLIAEDAFFWKPQVLEALVSLGWSEKEAGLALGKAISVEPDIVVGGNVSTILKATLKHASKV